MEIKKSLNTDIPGSISELQAIMKEFLLKYKIYKILLRGKGLEFETYRNYAPDDDSTTIDWKASKRANTILVKQYRDERNLKVMFLIDVSDNMVFGSAEKLKCEYAAEVTAAFVHLIITTGDKAGAIFFSNEIIDYMGPSGSMKQFNRLVDKLIDPQTYGGPADLNKVFEFALSYLKKNIDSVVIVSDFVTFSEKSKRNLTLLASKFETVVLMIRDQLDITLPDISEEIVIQDSRTGEQLLMNPTIAKHAYEKYAREQEELLRTTCARFNIEFLTLMTNKPFATSLAEFLKGRIKKKEGR